MNNSPNWPTKVTAEEEVRLVADSIRVLVEPSQVIELRALQVKTSRSSPYTISGYFDSDHLEDFAREALLLTEAAKGVYFTLNPVKPDILARRCNRTDRAGEGQLTADKDILCRRWLLIDVDPERDKKVSATDAEKADA